MVPHILTFKFRNAAAWPSSTISFGLVIININVKKSFCNIVPINRRLDITTANKILTKRKGDHVLVRVWFSLIVS